MDNKYYQHPDMDKVIADLHRFKDMDEFEKWYLFSTAFHSPPDFRSEEEKNKDKELCREMYWKIKKEKDENIIYN